MNVTIENVCVFLLLWHHQHVVFILIASMSFNDWQTVMDVNLHNLCLCLSKQYATHAKHNKSVGLISAADC